MRVDYCVACNELLMLINQNYREYAFFFISSGLLEGLPPADEGNYAEGRKKEIMMELNEWYRGLFLVSLS